MLSERFYDEVRTSPVPIEMRAMKALKKSPLALDIYFWLTYRLSYLRQARVIPWPALQMQFGASYQTDGQGARDFKRAFIRELKKVSTRRPRSAKKTAASIWGALDFAAITPGRISR